MVQEITVSSELIERLTERIEALEKKIDEKEAKPRRKKTRKKDTTRKLSDSINDITEDSIRGYGRFACGMIDATAEAFKEGANALSSISDDIDKEKLGSISAAFVSVMRKTIDIQTRALEKFEDSYEEYDDEA